MHDVSNLPLILPRQTDRRRAEACSQVKIRGAWRSARSSKTMRTGRLVDERHEEFVSAVEDYQGRVEALLISSEQYLSPGQMKEPWNLAEHGEPAEGLATLAWVISENHVRVDSWIIEGIRSLTEGIVEHDDLPSDLAEWVLPGS